MGNSNTENFRFIYDSYQSDIRLDIISEKPTEPSQYSLKICSDKNRAIKFAYQYGDGLVQIDKLINKKRASNILGEFLKISPDDIQGFIDFFHCHGFLYELSDDRFYKIDIIEIIKIQSRLQTLIELINQINDFNYDIIKIFELSYSLMFSSEWILDTIGKTKSSPNSLIKELIENTDISHPDNLSRNEETQKGYFEITDTIYGKYKLNSRTYREILSGYSSIKGSDNYIFQSITYLYANNKNLNSIEKNIIDCLFHFLYEIGIPKEYECGSKFQYFSFKKSDEQIHYLHDSIIDFAKFNIKNEIDKMIENIKPVYNEITMQPDWKIDSLLSSIYFSIFFMDSKQEMLRRCKYCGKLFLVKRTSSTKIYCDNYCTNNAQQAKQRLKKKEKSH